MKLEPYCAAFFFLHANSLGRPISCAISLKIIFFSSLLILYIGWIFIALAITSLSRKGSLNSILLCFAIRKSLFMSLSHIFFKPFQHSLCTFSQLCIAFKCLGSEEIFAGYERHLNAMQSWENVHKECWNGLKNMWERDMKRDFLIAKHNNIELRLPFLDKEVIASAMNIHPMYKISKDEKKIILREIAQEMGLPKEFAWRKKKAAQYGSNFIKGLDKLARMNRFEYKKDYLRSLV